MPIALPKLLFFCALSLFISSASLAADLGHGERVFKVCAPCHVIDSDMNKIGPHLKGVVGRPAGSIGDFRYSKAMTQAGDAGLVWDDKTLAEFLSSPKTKVPNTSMRFWGLWFQSEIDDLIAYLKANP
ncbi:c-type cytochrome [Aliirhizobium smilacinae]|uniref:Cytochrome c family protein n=1 Tax=Aliirhizobium smilacinae TaxID=1395944 RepID=A0A5C4XPT3_9HYPH|nr:cytochrome c family protein [Rhizobium smilacinae]TNM65423.1 cytochrome c family protein [Rhizobium smilacinae]